jgi:hypothetical protein
MVVNSQTKRARIAIIVAPNGARKTKQDHAQLPMNTEEMVAEAKACQNHDSFARERCARQTFSRVR